MDCVEAHGGDEATEADDEHGGDEPRVGVRRDATKVGQAHEVAEDVPAGRVFARVGAGGGWGQEAGRHAQAPGARLASRRGRRWRLLPAAARGERRREEPGTQEEVGRVGAEERGVCELRTRSHSAQKGEIYRHTAPGNGRGGGSGRRGASALRRAWTATASQLTLLSKRWCKCACAERARVMGAGSGLEHRGSGGRARGAGLCSRRRRGCSAGAVHGSRGSVDGAGLKSAPRRRSRPKGTR